ncbi:MAG: LysR family transcriptional regulator [Lachnospiraceae bacterium]|nr:LysR family transcriptional regulator [Lachnospiraceae bacterium]
MNILHMKYAVEVANAGSINKASEVLLIAQPNLSRSIKELEADLGITIFDRSAKGMVLTAEGERFIGYAKKILAQIDEVETMYKSGIPGKRQFSVCVPRASYVAEAFAQFSKCIGDAPAELFYKETNSKRAIDKILHSDYRLGIIRYAENYDKYFKTVFEEKGLNYELVTEFHYVLLMGKDSPLSTIEELRYPDLRPYIEIAHADPFVPSLALAEVKKEELPDNINRRIFVFERASQYELLSKNPDTFMWVSPVPDALLERYGLVQKICKDNQKIYKDVLIYKRDYHLTELDNLFITELCKAKRQYVK